MTSLLVYPVTSSNFGFTYSMCPAGSVMTTDVGLCSTARDRVVSNSVGIIGLEVGLEVLLVDGWNAVLPFGNCWRDVADIECASGS